MTKVSKVIETFSRAPSFNSIELDLLLSSFDTSANYRKLLVHNLIGTGRLKRISKGNYTFLDDVEVVCFAYKPSYYGLQEALSLMDLWEQETNPVVITPLRVVPGIRTFAGRNYLVRRIDRRMFFGIDLIRYTDFWVPVSDTEKTLIDFVYFREFLPEDTLTRFRRKINRKKLDKYLSISPAYVMRGVKRLLRRSS
ncbi:MAG: hypothetical protein M1442_01050 [Candidatus Thermoplasmatota archaeon]|nr:hypothetical protein [Candidatus Thermoplasmatota archaeon]